MMRLVSKVKLRKVASKLGFIPSARRVALPESWSRFYSWFQDGLFRRLFKNAGILFSGNAITALLGLLSVTLTARALGPEQFGMLVLIQTYVLVVNSLVNFQSWQALIKYGAEALEYERIEDFKSLVKFGTLLDVGTALLGTLIAVVAVFWVGRWQGWNQDTIHMAAIYSLVISFYLIGTPTAVLRLFDRFKLFAIQQVIASLVKLISVGSAFLLGGGLWDFLLAWMFSEIFAYSLLLIMAWIELRRQGYRDVFSASVRGISRRFYGLWRFVWLTNLTTSVKLAGRELDLLIVGAFVGIEATGIYKIAKYFAKVMTQVTDPLDQSIYPDLARLWVDGMAQKFRNFVFRIGVITGALGIVAWVGFVILGQFVLDLTVGPEYRAAYLPMVIFMAPIVFFMFGVGFRSAMLSMGQAGRVLHIHVLAYACYFLSLPLLLQQLEVVGAALAQFVFHSIWFVMMFISINRSVNKHLAQKSL